MNNNNINRKTTIAVLVFLVLAGVIIWQFDLGGYIKKESSNNVRAVVGEVVKIEAGKIYLQSESGEITAMVQLSTRFLAYDEAVKRLDSKSQADIKPGLKISVTYAGSEDQKEISAQFVTILKD